MSCDVRQLTHYQVLYEMVCLRCMRIGLIHCNAREHNHLARARRLQMHSPVSREREGERERESVAGEQWRYMQRQLDSQLWQSAIVVPWN